MDSFNKNAYRYNDYAIPQKVSLEHFLQFIHRQSFDNIFSEPTLELGAGTGLLTQKLIQKHPNLTALEKAPKMMHIGKQSVPQAHWIEADAFSYSKKKYHYLYSSHLLQWATDPLNVIKKWKSLLYPSGSMVLALFIKPTLSELYNIGPPSPFVWHPSHAWVGIFKQAKLSIQDYAIHSQKHYFKHALDLLRCLHHTGVAPKQKLTYTHTHALINNYNQIYASIHGVQSTWTSLYIHAKHA